MSNKSDALSVDEACHLAVDLSRHWAKSFERLEAFAAELRSPYSKRAVQQYAKAFWSWAIAQVKDQNVVKRLDALTCTDLQLPVENCKQLYEAKLKYLIRRAIFLAGLKYDKAHDSKWLRAFLDVMNVANKLDDNEVFEAVLKTRDRHRTRRLKREESTWGKLQYEILRGWLSGGLWALPSDAQRADRLNTLLALDEKISKSGFTKTRKRLKLLLG